MSNLKIFLITLIIFFVLLRTFLFIWPFVNVNIGQYNIKHLFPGAFLLTILIPFLLIGINNKRIAVLAGIGSAAVADEILYLIVTDGADLSYLSPISFFGGIFFITIIIAVSIIAYYNKG